jgi:hypothetical protein
MKRLRVPFAMLAWSLAAAVWAAAQPAASFLDVTQRGFQLRRGEAIEITDAQGNTFKAGFEAISATSLVARVEGASREFNESDIRELRYLKPDSLKSGMLIGLGAGALVGLVALRSACSTDWECAVHGGLAFVPIFAGSGLGVGALADASIRKKETIFLRPGAPGRTGLNIAPVLSRKRAGVRMSFVF